MKEYRILREIENPRMGPNNHQLLEDRINALARDGWTVNAFQVSHATSTSGPVVSINTWFSALMERDARTGGSP